MTRGATSLFAGASRGEWDGKTITYTIRDYVITRHRRPRRDRGRFQVRDRAIAASRRSNGYCAVPPSSGRRRGGQGGSGEVHRASRHQRITAPDDTTLVIERRHDLDRWSLPEPAGSAPGPEEYANEFARKAPRHTARSRSHRPTWSRTTRHLRAHGLHPEKESPLFRNPNWQASVVTYGAYPIDLIRRACDTVSASKRSSP